MLLSIEPDGPVPIYQQIRDQIIEAIAGGGQPAGSGQSLEWVIRAGKDPMMLPNGKPLTVRFELDMAGAPPVFQRGYWSRMACVAELAH